MHTTDSSLPTTSGLYYSGEYYDVESGLIYLRNRYYNPETGRFTQEDPYWNIHNMIYGDEYEKKSNYDILDCVNAKNEIDVKRLLADIVD